MTPCIQSPQSVACTDPRSTCSCYVDVMYLRIIGMIMAIFVACALPNLPLQPDDGLSPPPPTNSPLIEQVTVAGQHQLALYEDGLLAIRDVPWFHQGNDRTCAQANVASLLNYWGIPMSYADVVQTMNPLNLPTDVRPISLFLQSLGLQAQEYRLATPNFLKQQIHLGRPTLVLLDFGNLPSLHYVLVTGYNDLEGYYLISDPIERPDLRMSYATFERMWQNHTMRQLGVGDRYSRVAFDVWLSQVQPMQP